jgi:hypothetical protein
MKVKTNVKAGQGITQSNTANGNVVVGGSITQSNEANGNVVIA